MSSCRPLVALLLAVLAASASPARAAGDIVDIAWSPQGRFVHESRVAPGRFVELCGPVKPGRPVRWSFEADAPLDFNIHYHVDQDVVYPARERQVTRGADRLSATAAKDHCWMWTNGGTAPVALRVELAR